MSVEKEAVAAEHPAKNVQKKKSGTQQRSTQKTTKTSTGANERIERP